MLELTHTCPHRSEILLIRQETLWRLTGGVRYRLRQLAKQKLSQLGRVFAFECASCGGKTGKVSENGSLEQNPVEEGLGNRVLPAAGRGSPDGGRGFVSVVESSEPPTGGER